jgi:hypothetical protein
MPTPRTLCTLLFFVLLAVPHLACGRADPAVSAGARGEPAPAAAPGGGGAQSPSLPAQDRAVRITVETTVVVQHRDAAVAGLRSALADLGGYVSSGSVSGQDETGAASFEVKVPAAKVGVLREALRSLGDVRSDAEKAEDVTEARADVQARLANARAEETRMLALLSDRTGSLSDVVAVEKELARVRETIERIEAEEHVLLGQIGMATVKVQLETSYVYSEPSAGSRLAKAAKEGAETAWAFVVGTGVFLLVGGPTLIILAAMAYAAFLSERALRRGRRARVAARPSP